DAMYWFSISLFHRDRFRFVLRHLELTSDPDRPELFRKEKRKQVEHFLRTYLKVDGVLVLRMIALHAGVMYCTEITDALWKRYLSQHPENLIDEDSSLINFARFSGLNRLKENESTLAIQQVTTTLHRIVVNDRQDSSSVEVNLHHVFIMVKAVIVRLMRIVRHPLEHFLSGRS
uniref:Innexin n=1 Tax=Parascaris univalens TaxID=6257 RepID=A0A914ZJK8_PARUN